MPQIPITMPQLGESIAEAIVVDIQVQPGDTVAADQEIMEVETNKAVMSVTTPSDGVIDRVTAEKDVSYAVGATLGYLTVSTDAANQLGLSDPGDSRVSAESDDTAGVHFKVEDDAVPQIDAEQIPSQASN